MSNEPARAVEGAIQNLMAARLGRAFVPLGLAFVVGVVRVIAGEASGAVVVGAMATLVATLGYGLRVVQRALSRPHRAWMSVAMIGSVIPPVYAVYLLAWLGLRGLSVTSPAQLAIATLHVALGVWVLRAWMKVVEIERLAQVMIMNPQDGGTR